MVGAVDQADGNIDHREAEGAAIEVVAHPDFDAWDVVLGHHAAGNLIGELETRPARARLDGDNHVAELPVSPGLLLVATAHLDRFADRLLVGDLARPG